MAQWRGKKRQQRIATLGVLGAAAFGLLVWIATRIPWDSVSFVTLILILLILAGFSLHSLVNVAKFHIAKAQKIERASKVKTVAQMGFMSSAEFEHYVAMLYERLGYKATVTKQSGDGGIDIILKNSEGTAAVQVKRNKSDNIVGRPLIQKLIGAGRSYDKLIFVTSSDFSREARVEAADAGMLLVDGKGVETMAEKIFGDEYHTQTFAFKFNRKMERL